MIYSPLDELLKHAGNNKYTLVNITAKRARQIIEAGYINNERLDNAVSIAFGEILNGKIKFEKVNTDKK
jgi:DNA-directed RNA polymerase omega subunit